MKWFLPALAAALLTFSSNDAAAQIAVDGGASKAADLHAARGTLMADAATRFLGSLDDAQRARASFAYDDAERLNWHWIPRPRKGLPVKDLTSNQRALAFALLNTGLSSKGMITASTTMSYEEIIRAEEKDDGSVRNPELYFISVFGTPGEGAWGWRWEGHHLALNFTLRDDKVVAATPFMLGANPASVASGPNKGLRNLAEIQDPIYALVASLDADQREAAVVSEEVPDVTSTPNSPRPEPSTGLGISSESLKPEQEKLIGQAVKAYLATFPDGVVECLLDQLHKSPGEFHFAWYGPTDPSKPHAFRLQGPTLLIDFNNKQNNANHIHTFYRNGGDFGLSAAK